MSQRPVRVGELVLDEFPYLADAFVPGYGARDVLLTYGAVGGLPGHLALLNRTDALEANLTRLLLDPGGRLADEAEHMLDAFLGDADVHYSIIQAIATGERTWSKIANRLASPAAPSPVPCGGSRRCRW